jgi:hypothetical protein
VLFRIGTFLWSAITGAPRPPLRGYLFLDGVLAVRSARPARRPLIVAPVAGVLAVLWLIGSFTIVVGA